MELQEIFGQEAVKWIILPLMIFFARIVDVTIGTLRIIYVSKGMRMYSMICGFIEVLVWLIAITQIMQHLSNFMMYFGWAAGFAVGNYVGITIERRIAIGNLVVRIILQQDPTELIEQLRKEKYGVTSFAGAGMNGEVRLLLTVIHRKYLDAVVKLIHAYNPKAFYSVEDVRAVSDGFLPMHSKRNFASLLSVRKHK